MLDLHLVPFHVRRHNFAYFAKSNYFQSVFCTIPPTHPPFLTLVYLMLAIFFSFSNLSFQLLFLHFISSTVLLLSSPLLTPPAFVLSSNERKKPPVDLCSGSEWLSSPDILARGSSSAPLRLAEGIHSVALLPPSVFYSTSVSFNCATPRGAVSATWATSAFCHFSNHAFFYLETFSFLIFNYLFV